MWRCPRCDEQLEDTFDVCWNCGTTQSGTPCPAFEPEPDDPSVPDPGPEPEQARIETKYLREYVRHFVHLPADKQTKMLEIARVLVAERRWEGGSGFQVTEEMKFAIAAQASLLVLGLEEPYYFNRVPSIIVYPRPYLHPASMQRDYLIASKNLPVYGEAWQRGPVIVSWQEVVAAGRNASGGKNLVLHEFAHHVDGLDGDMDGTPPLAGRERQRTWHRVIEGEYRRLVGSTRRAEATLLDQYGASNRAEFFAVATECFFEQPRAMQHRHQELYAVLRDFYQQDPAVWLPDADVRDRRMDEEAVSEERDQSRASGQRSEDESCRTRKRQDLEQRIRRARDVDALFTAAIVCLNEQEHDLAEEALTRVIQLDPSDAEAYHQRAVARVELGKYEEALADCQEALRCDPDDATPYSVRGTACIGLRQYERAIEDLSRFLEEKPDDPQARYLRGVAWSRLGNPKKAIKDLSWAIVSDPFLAEAYFERSQAQRELGRFDEADADLEKARQIDPQVGPRK